MSFAGVGITKEDFENNALADLGKTATVTPITETEDELGNKTFSEGTPYTESVVFIQKDDQRFREKYGLTSGKDAIILTATGTSINKGDKVQFALEDGTFIFKVYNEIDRDAIYRIFVLYFWEDA